MRPYTDTMGYRLVRCPQCGLVRTLGIEAEEAEKLYQESDYYSAKGGSGFDLGGFLKEGLSDPLTRYYQTKRWAPLSQALQKRFPSERICHLDIGCSAGHFLAIGKALGWEMAGIESSPVAAQFANEKLGVNVSCGTIESIELPDHSYHSISLFHVLEHINDPRSCLKKLKRALKPNGLLAIEVPNVNSLPARLRKQSWHGYVLPYHLWHFSLAAVTKLLDQSGFSVLMWETPYEPFSSSHLFNVHGGINQILQTLRSKGQRNKIKKDNSGPHSQEKGQEAGQSPCRPGQAPTSLLRSLGGQFFKGLYWPSDRLMAIMKLGESLYIIAGIK